MPVCVSVCVCVCVRVHVGGGGAHVGCVRVHMCVYMCVCGG